MQDFDVQGSILFSMLPCSLHITYSTGHPLARRNRNPGSAWISYLFLLMSLFLIELVSYLRWADTILTLILVLKRCSFMLLQSTVSECTPVTGRACARSTLALFRVYSCWWSLTPSKRSRQQTWNVSAYAPFSA